MTLNCDCPSCDCSPCSPDRCPCGNACPCKNQAVKDKSKMTFNVKKRDGSDEQFDISKIRYVLEIASQGLGVDTLKLESKIQIRFSEGIQTRDIQANLVEVALSLTSATEPDWKIVAARLYLMDFRKELYLRRRYNAGGQNYYRHVKTLTRKNLYDPLVLNTYSDVELKAAGKWMDESYDDGFDYAGANMMVARYLVSEGGKPSESIQEAFLTLALSIASKANPQRRMAFAKELYEAFAQRKISLATPFLRNLRRPNGSLTSCFVLQMDDSRDSIFYVIDQIARISKNGGGVGVDITPVRARGSSINGIPGVSGGIAPWIKIGNDTAVAVNQEGVRSGAVTFALRVWHADILEFLELQTENGDQRRKAYDIYPQVVIPDLFMKRAEEKGTWTLCCPFEVQKVLGINLVDTWGEEFERRYAKVEKAAQEGKLKVTKTIQAAPLLHQMMKTQVETGLPYIMFIDTWNRMNPNQHDGMIPSVNLCVESVSNVVRTSQLPKTYNVVDPSAKHKEITQSYIAGYAHCCNLSSLNLAEIKTVEELIYYTTLATQALDYSIDLTSPPIPEAKFHNDRYRTVGLGVLGWADWLAIRGLNYRSPRAREEATRVFELIAYHSFKASHELAKELGSFEAFEYSVVKVNERLLGKTADELGKDGFLGKEAWQTLIHDINNNGGLRNSQLLAIAPTTSTALVQGASPSILPTYGHLYYDKNGRQTVPLTPPHLAKVNPLLDYPEYRNIEPTAIIQMTAEIQKWVDTGISMEFILNLNLPDINAGTFLKAIFEAWKSGCKSIYYVRSIQKGIQDLKGVESVCVSCAN